MTPPPVTAPLDPSTGSRRAHRPHAGHAGHAGHVGVRAGVLHAALAGSDREQGSNSIQMAVLMPALFLVMFLGMQGALFYHARTVAIAAAQEGARSAASLGGSASQGAQDAYSFVADAGGDGVLLTPRVTSDRTAVTATVTVTGSSLSVIPGWSPTVTQTASLPVERLTS